jgi:tetratricopeptide (TPR) repeat protein
MSGKVTRIKECEARIEEALWSHEIAGENERALEAYQAVEADLGAFLGDPTGPVVAEVQRVLAYCLMREGNVLRVLGRSDEAGRLSEREIVAARASGDSITLARSLMSHGTNLVVGGSLDAGRRFLEEARSLFANGDSRDHRQGVGWCWILQADLMNAGLVVGDARDVIAAADRALAELLPIESWPGIARAHGARAQAHERLGDAAAAEADRAAQREAEAKVQPDEPG